MSEHSNDQLVAASPSALDTVREALLDIPDVEEDPTPRMMAAIVQAGSAGEWEQLFSAENLRDNAGKRIRVHALRKAPSQFEGPLGVFFICDVTMLESGEETVLTLSSQIAMAQLLNCYLRGDLPHDFEIVKKATPTRKGFHPIRLRSLGRPVGAGREV